MIAAAVTLLVSILGVNSGTTEASLEPNLYACTIHAERAVKALQARGQAALADCQENWNQGTHVQTLGGMPLLQPDPEPKAAPKPVHENGATNIRAKPKVKVEPMADPKDCRRKYRIVNHQRRWYLKCR